MKTLLIACLLLSQSYFSQIHQTDSTLSKGVQSAFFILDETWAPNNPLRFKTDETPNYIQLEGMKAVICSRTRRSDLFIEGEIDAYSITEEEGQKITRFFIRGKERSNGKVVSIEIFEKESGEILIHVFQKLGSYDTYFSAHVASTSEKKEIDEYWKTH